jgi:hypothetical protein
VNYAIPAIVVDIAEVDRVVASLLVVEILGCDYRGLEIIRDLGATGSCLEIMISIPQRTHLERVRERLGVLNAKLSIDRSLSRLLGCYGWRSVSKNL